MKNASADLAEIWHSFASILFTPTLKISSSGQVRSRSYDVIHDVMFGRNRPILLSIVSGRVSLLSGVCFCIAGSINGVYGYLEAIYSCPGVKVMPGHASMGRFRSPF